MASRTIELPKSGFAIEIRPRSALGKAQNTARSSWSAVFRCFSRHQLTSN